jgi:hypothetical protein
MISRAIRWEQATVPAPRLTSLSHRSGGAMSSTTHLLLVPKLSLETTSRLAGLLVTLSSFAMTGCGDSSRAGVQGTVTLDGAPVDGGRIMFIPTDSKGHNAYADIKEGKYEVAADKGPSLGTHKVEILWYKKTGKKVVGSDPPNLVEEKVQLIPEKYNTKSSVKEEIKPGMNTINYDLKKR